MMCSAWSIFLSTHTGRQASQNNPDAPDIFIIDTTAIILNKDGAPALRLVTPKMIHYPKNDTTRITLPKVTIFKDAQSPWEINAAYAKTTAGINEISFWDNVNILHAGDKDSPKTAVQTSSLSIFPKQQIASTTEPITLTQPDVIIHATGFVANLASGTVKLLSQAHGNYAPTP